MRYFSLLFAATLFTGLAGAQSSVEWLEAGNTDLVARTLVHETGALPTSRHSESRAITYAWAADAGHVPAAAGNGVEVESRQYWVDTTGRALERGVKLPVSAPGAVIRVSALEQGSELRLDPGHMALAINGQAIDRTAVEGLATGDQMRREGMSVPRDSLAFRLPADGQAGTLELNLAGAPADLPLVIHVHEADSPWVARMASRSQNFLGGQPIDFEVILSNGESEFAIEQIDAVMVGPNAAKSWTLSRNGDARRLHGRIDADTLVEGPGLYEAHVYANHVVDGVMVRRDLKLAFSVAPPIGRFTGEIGKLDAASGFGIGLEVEVAAAGRYQVNGELYATDAEGNLQPAAFMQSATELEPGTDVIDLEVDPGVLAGTSLTPPMEIRNLQLLDQGRMYLLEERAQAIRIGVRVRRGPLDVIEQ